MPSRYDRIASHYDSLAQFVFGKSIVQAQKFGLSEISQGSHILIVGGGTGHVLEHLSECRISELHIDYVEASDAMIEIARSRKIDGLYIDFIRQRIEELRGQKNYDVIITQFFLDCFEGVDLKRVFSMLNNRLKDNGIWIIADFQLTKDWKKIWQKPLLSIMYLFFSIAVGLQARKLEDFPVLFTQLGYRLRKSRSYYARFIFSSTYQKSA